MTVELTETQLDRLDIKEGTFSLLSLEDAQLLMAWVGAGPSPVADLTPQEALNFYRLSGQWSGHEAFLEESRGEFFATLAEAAPRVTRAVTFAGGTIEPELYGPDHIQYFVRFGKPGDDLRTGPFLTYDEAVDARAGHPHCA